MSRSIKIACLTHKRRLWIGQNRYIYTDEPRTMELLNSFFQAHPRWEGCTLALTDENDDEIYSDGWKEFTDNEETE